MADDGRQGIGPSAQTSGGAVGEDTPADEYVDS